MRSNSRPFGARKSNSFDCGESRRTGIVHSSMCQTKSCCDASSCSMPGTSREWWHCNGSENGPNVRPDCLRATSIVALEHAPMCMVVAFRVLSPCFSLVIERFLPHPHRISALLVDSMGIMVAGAGGYSAGLLVDNPFSGLPWIIFNMLLAVADRLVQRSTLAQDQAPVDISLSGVTLLNKLWGCMFLLIAAVVLGEWQELPVLLKPPGSEHVRWFLCSCFVGMCISFTGIFVLKRISATRSLVLINVNKFGIIFLEALVMGTKSLSTSQIFDVSVAISGGVLSGQAHHSHLVQATLSSIFHVPYTLSMASIDPTPEEMQQWTDISSVLSWAGLAGDPDRGRISFRFVSSTSGLHVDGTRACVGHDFCY